jgi:hypothetical protein
VARRLWTVTLYTSFAPSGEGCNGYVAGDYVADPIVSETALGQFQASAMSFKMRDKLGPKAQRYWSNRIQQSTGTFTMSNGQRTDLPFIRVLDTTDGDAFAVPVFEGWIERNQLQWENDVVTGFTAVSQLSYMDRHSASGYGVEGFGFQLCKATTGTGAGSVWTATAWGSGEGDYISTGIIPGDYLKVGAHTVVIVASVDSATKLTLTTSVDGWTGASYVTRLPVRFYSGHAAPLVRRMLRITGNISPNLTAGEAPDVAIHDYPLGTGQANTDWNHVLRQQAAAGKDPVYALGLSEVVQSMEGAPSCQAQFGSESSNTWIVGDDPWTAGDYLTQGVVAGDILHVGNQTRTISEVLTAKIVKYSGATITSPTVTSYVARAAVTRMGFVCQNGGLYRIDKARTESGRADNNGIKLTPITTKPSGETEAVNQGYRLFPYTIQLTADGATPCLAVVQTVVEPSYTTTAQRILDPYVAAGQTAGGVALTIFKASTPAAIAATAGLAIVGGALRNMTATVKVTPTGTYYRRIRVIHIMSIGDGTDNAYTGVGAMFNSTVPGLTGATPTKYVPPDSVCVSGPYTGLGSLLWVDVFDSSAGTLMEWTAKYELGSWSSWANYTFAGVPAGGLAAQLIYGKTLVCHALSNAVVVTGGDNGVKRITLTSDHQSSRFVSSLVTVNGINGIYRIAFFPEAESDHYIQAVIFDRAGGSGFKDVTLSELTIDPGAAAVTDFRVICAGQAAEVDGVNSCPVLYRGLNAAEEQYVYAGLLYYDSIFAEVKLNSTYCTKAVPSAQQSETIPPFIYEDTSSPSSFRFVTACSNVNGKKLVTDWFYSGLSAIAFVHHDFLTDPISARQFVLTCAQSFGLQLKLLGCDHPSGATLCKVMSRHAWSPHSLGTVTRVAQARDSKIVGTEYYLGAEGNAYGERVTVSTCPNAGERHVYPVGGAFSQPVWLRALGGWIVAAYPERNATYTNGRRIVETTIHKIIPVLPATTPYVPGYDNVYGQATLTLFTAGNITGLLLGLGFNRRTGAYRATFIEWNSTDTTWTGDAVDPTVVECAIVTETTITAPAAVGASAGRIIHWDVMASPTNTGQTNPVDGPCAFAFTVDLCRPLRLKRYGIKLTATGTSTSGGVLMAFHYDSGGVPGLEIVETRAGIGGTPGVGLDGLSAGWNWFDLDVWNNGNLTEWELAPGLYWIVASIDRQDSVGITKPPIVWFDSLQVTPRAKRLAFAADTGLPELPLLNYFGNVETSWDDDLDDDMRYAPAIYAGGD